MPFPSSIEKFEGLITIRAFVKLIDIKSWNIKWKIKLSKYLLLPLSSIHECRTTWDSRGFLCILTCSKKVAFLKEIEFTFYHEELRVVTITKISF